MRRSLCACALAILLCAGSCLAGCASHDQAEQDAPSSSAEQQADDAQIEEAFLASTDAFAHTFASAALADATGNRCVSPLSLYYALAMVASGVQGDAQTQIMQALGVEDISQLEDICSYGISELSSEADQYKLALADSVWISDDYRFTDTFKKVVAEDYHAEALSVEFGTPQADADMSKWVSDKTAGLLSPTFTTTADQIAALINTIYFKDAWVKQFKADDTAARAFHTRSGDVRVPFMNATIEGCGFAEADAYTMSEMYFTGGSVMTFYLPKEGVSPHDLISTPVAASSLLSTQPTDYPDIAYSVPKFSFSTDMADLIPLLKSFGIQDIFTNETGDAFDTMLEYAGEGSAGVPYISEVIQQTTVNVAEEGVEAAAYTEAGIMKMSAGGQAEPIAVVLDRPFLFKISAPDSSVIFVGVMNDPTV